MTPQDMIYNETYKGCLKAGCDDRLSKDTAVMTLQKYKNGQYSNKPSKLISQAITEAKKLIVKKRR